MRTPGLFKAQGIYAIECPVARKAYVGQTNNASVRLASHRYKLRRGIHPNVHLQNVWNVYGEEAFKFYLVERVDDPALLTAKEQHHMNVFSASYVMCNVTKAGASTRGHKMSDETRRRMSEAQKGHAGADWSAEARARISEARKGRPETAARIAAAQARRGRALPPRSPEHCLAISEGHARRRALLEGIA